MVVEGSTKHWRVGYWGDVLTGPFPALALASTDPRAASTQNNRNMHVRNFQVNTEHVISCNNDGVDNNTYPLLISIVIGAF